MVMNSEGMCIHRISDCFGWGILGFCMGVPWGGVEGCSVAAAFRWATETVYILCGCPQTKTYTLSILKVVEAFGLGESVGRAKKRYKKLAKKLRDEHPEWTGLQAYVKAVDMDQREQAALQAKRWRSEYRAGPSDRLVKAEAKELVVERGGIKYPKENDVACDCVYVLSGGGEWLDSDGNPCTHPQGGSKENDVDPHYPSGISFVPVCDDCGDPAEWSDEHQRWEHAIAYGTQGE